MPTRVLMNTPDAKNTGSIVFGTGDGAIALDNQGNFYFQSGGNIHGWWSLACLYTRSISIEGGSFRLRYFEDDDVKIAMSFDKTSKSFIFGEEVTVSVENHSSRIHCTESLFIGSIVNEPDVTPVDNNTAPGDNKSLITDISQYLNLPEETINENAGLSINTNYNPEEPALEGIRVVIPRNITKPIIFLQGDGENAESNTMPVLELGKNVPQISVTPTDSVFQYEMDHSKVMTFTHTKIPFAHPSGNDEQEVEMLIDSETSTFATITQIGGIIDYQQSLSIWNRVQLTNMEPAPEVSMEKVNWQCWNSILNTPTMVYPVANSTTGNHRLAVDIANLLDTFCGRTCLIPINPVDTDNPTSTTEYFFSLVNLIPTMWNVLHTILTKIQSHESELIKSLMPQGIELDPEDIFGPPDSPSPTPTGAF